MGSESPDFRGVCLMKSSNKRQTKQNCFLRIGDTDVRMYPRSEAASSDTWHDDWSRTSGDLGSDVE